MTQKPKSLRLSANLIDEVRTILREQKIGKNFIDIHKHKDEMEDQDQEATRLNHGYKSNPAVVREALLQFIDMHKNKNK